MSRCVPRVEEACLGDVGGNSGSAWRFFDAIIGTMVLMLVWDSFFPSSVTQSFPRESWKRTWA